MAYFGGTVSAKPWSKIDARFVLLFLLSFAGIAASVLIAHNLLQPPTSPRPPQALSSISSITRPNTTLALVATKEISAGTKLLPSMFKLESRELVDSDQGAIKDPDEVVGRYARVDITRNTPIIRSALTANTTPPDIGERIPTGHRAVAIPVNALTGVEGWVRPGAHVDVVWSTEREKQFVVVTIVENAKVLSVERSLDTDQPTSLVQTSNPNHITLVVPSLDAQKIQLAKSSGSLSLSLRGVEDQVEGETSLLTSENLLLRRSARDEVKGKVVLDGTEYGFVHGELVPMSELDKGSAYH